MSVRTDVINLTINVNGNAAQNQLNELRKKAADLKVEMKDLKKAGKEGTQQWIDADDSLTAVNKKMTELKQTIGITSLTQKELNAELKKLNALKGSVTPFSKEFKEFQLQIDAVNSRLYDVKNGVQGFASFVSKISDSVKQFGVVAAGYLGFQFITSQFQNIIKGAGKLSDQLADLRRVAGLTAVEATKLSSSLGKIDTRTSVSSLRDIAIVAGKLGVAKDDIFDFTKAVDQLVVSLGDELGDADQITTQLGKILNVFDGKVDGDNITKLGNAFIQLANTGSATGAFIADFDQRLSGIAKSAGISLGALSGLGAGLEEMGGKVESSSTAIQKLIISIASDIPAAAKIAGQSTQEFDKLFKLDPTEAILKYSEGLVKSKESFAAVTASLKDAGEEGARTIETITKLGTGADHLRERIDLGKKSIEESSAITEAFRIKNETFGASIDKLGKELYAFVNQSGITTFLKATVEGVINLIKFLKDLPNWLQENRTAIIAVTTVLLAYIAAKTKSTQSIILNRLATLLETAADKLEAAQKIVNTFLTTAYGFAKDVLTGKIKLATVAQRIWNLVLKANPLVLIITLVGALATAISFLASRYTGLTAATRLAIEIQKRVGDATIEQVTKVNLLTNVINDHNVSLDNRKKALQQLIDISPEYLNGLTLENLETEAGKKIINDYVTSLNKRAEAEAKYSLLVEKLKARNEANSELQKADKALPKSTGAIIASSTLDAFGFGTYAKYDDAKKKVSDLDDEIKLLQTDVASTTKKNLETVAGSVTTTSEQTIGLIKRLQDAIKVLDDSRPNLLSKNAINENLAQRKKLQDQLDALEGKTKNESRSEKKEDSLLKEAQAFRKKIDDLVFQSAEASKSADQKEIDSVKRKFDEILKDYDVLIKKLNGKNKGILGPRKTIVDAGQKELEEAIAKQTKNNLTKAYEDRLVQSQQFYDAEKEAQDKRFVDREISEKVYRANVAHIDEQSKQAQLDIAEEFSKKTILVDGKQVLAVEKATKDLTALKKAQLDQQTKDLIAAYHAQEAERKLIESLDRTAATAKIETKIIIAKGSGNTKQELAAQKELLAEQRKQKLAALEQDRKDAIQSITSTGAEAFEKEMQIDKDINTEKAKIDAEYRASEEQLEIDSKLRKIEIARSYIDTLANIASQGLQIFSNLDQQEISKEKKKNDAKVNSYRSLLDRKLISQKKYDSLVAKQDEEFAKKKHAIELKSFKQQQALGITIALINGAVAVTKILAETPKFDFGIATAIEIAAAAITTAAQVGVIATQSPPEAGEGALLSKGPYHRDKEKGLHVIDPRTGKTELLLEKDEMVIKGSATRSNQKYTVTGTPAQIGSKLNSMHGGVSWAAGAHVEAPKWRTAPAPQINSHMPRIMEQGGVIRPLNTSSTSSTAENSELTVLLTRILQSSEELKDLTREKADKQIQTISDKNERLHAVVSIREFKAEEAKYNAAKRGSSLNG